MAILGATAVGMGEKLGRIQSMGIFTIIPFPHSHPYHPFPTQGGCEPHLVNGFHPQFYIWKITTRLWDHVVYIYIYMIVYKHIYIYIIYIYIQHVYCIHIQTMNHGSLGGCPSEAAPCGVLSAESCELIVALRGAAQGRF